MPNTIRLHRVLRASPERVYKAFLDPDAMAKWLPPNGFTGKVHHADAKVVRSPSLARVEELLTDYARRIVRDHQAVLPPADKATA